MDIRESEFFKELLSMFKMESTEHIQTMLTGLDNLEKHANTPKQLEIAEIVHRSAHSLKGAARTIGLSDMEAPCQSLELNFSQLKREKTAIPPELFALFRQAVNKLGVLLASINENGKVVEDKSELVRLVEEINSKMATLNK
jgi:two-component system chemotaxis sensor kinase CheA